MTKKWKEIIEIDKETRAKGLRKKVEDTQAPKEQETDQHKTPYDKRVRDKQLIDK